MLFFGILLGAIGAYSVFGGASDWEWFLSHRSARPVVSLLGREKARLFYVLLGLALAAIGAVLIWRA